MERRLEYPVFDADNHMYEQPDAFTRFLPDDYKHVIKYVQVNGRDKLAIKNVISEYIPNPTFTVVARPGAQEDFFKNGNPEGKSRREILGDPIRTPEAFFKPQPRLELMDEQGVDRAIMWPTLASVLEERLHNDPEASHVIIHSLNQWMHEEWTFNYKDRIFPAPVITLPIVDEAIRELDWVVERGAKIILIRPAPVPSLKGFRSFALPEFDPFWAKVQEYDVTVGMHASDDGLTRYFNQWQGHTGRLSALCGHDGVLHRATPHEPRHLRRHAFGNQPRHAVAVPRPACAPGRERLQLGAATDQCIGAGLRAAAAPVRGGPRRRPSTEHLDPPLLRRGPRWPHQGHRHRPRCLRLRLSPPRGSC